MNPRDRRIRFVEGADRPELVGELARLGEAGYALLEVADGDRRRGIVAKYSLVPLVGTWHFSHEELPHG